MTDDTGEDDGYTYEPSVAEQGIRSLVRKAAQRGYDNRQIRDAIREMLNDERVARPTAEQLDSENAARKMFSEFGDRLDRARSRLRNGETETAGTTGLRINLHPPNDMAGNDGRPVDILVPEDDEPNVVAIVRKVEYGHPNTHRVESVYPLVKVGNYAVCTCPDRHYRRQEGGTCYHELAYDIKAGEQEASEAHESATVKL